MRFIDPLVLSGKAILARGFAPEEQHDESQCHPSDAQLRYRTHYRCQYRIHNAPSLVLVSEIWSRLVRLVVHRPFLGWMARHPQTPRPWDSALLLTFEFVNGFVELSP